MFLKPFPSSEPPALLGYLLPTEASLAAPLIPPRVSAWPSCLLLLLQRASRAAKAPLPPNLPFTAVLPLRP